ncbi:MAG: hypothetical protein AAFP20_08395 [Cyanobacteria bacterium J06614_10]
MPQDSVNAAPDTEPSQQEAASPDALPVAPMPTDSQPLPPPGSADVQTPDAQVPGSSPGTSAPDSSELPDFCDLLTQIPQPATTSTYTVVDEQQSPKYEVPGTDVFRTETLPAYGIQFDEYALLSTLQSTRTYFTEQSCQDPKILKSGILGTQDVEVSDVLDTLDFMIQVLSEDLVAGQPTRLKDATFINQNFKVVRWLAYDPQNLNETRLRITKYAVFTHPGSRSPTEVFNTPVYRLKDDLTDESFIANYTKQEVLSGIYEPGGAEFGKVETLAYLSRESFEDALLQGTAYVTFPDGSATYFNVDKNNGIAYVPGLDQWQQERYWYFKEVDQLKGYGHSSETKIAIDPGVTFAGDVLNIGLGKIIAIEDNNQNIRIGMVADTGGAFLPNLHQLDFFAGVFPSRSAYEQAVQPLPTYARTYILLKK